MSIEKFEYFIEPKEIEVGGKSFVISKFPAMIGRKIVTQYISSGLPKIGDYNSNEEIMLLLMKHVAAKNEEGKATVLSTRGLIDSHITPMPSMEDERWEMLGKIEAATMEYNCSFFRGGRISNFFRDIAQKLPQLITKILKDSLAPLSRQGSQPTNN